MARQLGGDGMNDYRYDFINFALLILQHDRDYLDWLLATQRPDLQRLMLIGDVHE